MGGLEPPLNMCRFRALGEAGVTAPDLVIGAGRESSAGVGVLIAITVLCVEPLRRGRDDRRAGQCPIRQVIAGADENHQDWGHSRQEMR